MRIAILGAGALGVAMGGILTHNGVDVELVDLPQNVAILNKKGVYIKGAYDIHVPVKAVVPGDMQGVYDVGLLLVKQMHTKAVLENFMRFMSSTSVVCSMQNGVPEETVASFVGENRVLGSSVGFGATRLGPNISEITSTQAALKAFALYLGELDGSISPRARTIADILSLVGLCKPVDNIMSVKWSKLMTNSTFSGMSAACNCTFGDVLDADEALGVAACIASEVVTVAHSQGVRLTTLQGQDYEFFAMQDPVRDLPSRFEAFRRVWEKHRLLKASMLQDMEQGIPCEIDYINGHVCAKGQIAGIPTPYNAMVVTLVKEAQQQGRLPVFAESLARFASLRGREA